ncbi:MAG: flagellar hook-length control protein FliK [Pseudomonadota bacterium]
MTANIASLNIELTPVHSISAASSDNKVVESNGKDSNNNNDVANKDSGNSANSDFGKLVATPLQPKANNSQANNKPASDDNKKEPANSASNDNKAEIAQPLIPNKVADILLNLQSIVPESKPQDVLVNSQSINIIPNLPDIKLDAKTDKNATSEADLLQNLEKILQQLLQATLADSKTSKQQSDKFDVSSKDASTSKDKEEKLKNDNSISDLLNQLFVIYNQLVDNSNSNNQTQNFGQESIKINPDLSSNDTNKFAQIILSFDKNITQKEAIEKVFGNEEIFDPSKAINNNGKQANFLSLINDLLANIKSNGDKFDPKILQNFLKEVNVAPQLNNPIVTAKDSTQNNILAVTEIFAEQNNTDNKSGQGGDKNSSSDKDSFSSAVNIPSNINLSQNVAPPEFSKIVNAPSAQPHIPVSEQILVQIKNSSETGQSQIKIELTPENLGKVEVRMVTNSEGKTEINITADNRNTLAMLQNEARSLEDALRDIGLKTNSGGLSFNLRNGQQNDGRGSGNNSGKFTQVSAINDDDINSGTTIASNNLSYNSRYNNEYFASYRLLLKQGVDIRI